MPCLSTGVGQIDTGDEQHAVLCHRSGGCKKRTEWAPQHGQIIKIWLSKCWRWKKFQW